MKRKNLGPSRMRHANAFGGSWLSVCVYDCLTRKFSLCTQKSSESSGRIRMSKSSGHRSNKRAYVFSWRVVMPSIERQTCMFRMTRITRHSKRFTAWPCFNRSVCFKTISSRTVYIIIIIIIIIYLFRNKDTV